MNTLALLLLSALLAEYLLKLAAELLNLRALSPEVPEEFRECVDAEAYRRSREYTRTRTLFQLLPTSLSLCLLLVFWFGGGFAWLDEVTRSLGQNEVLTGLAFIGSLVVVQSLLALPFRLYSTFVIEERFGFNRTTPRTFWLDGLKGLLLSGLLGLPLLAGLLYLLGRAGDNAWIGCFVLVAVFTLGLQYLAPSWLLPLFNRFEALPDGELREAILEYADSVAFPLSDVFVMDGSRRSSKANAFFTGFGKNRRVVLLDTLVASHSVAELVAVFAHEIGHFKRHHIQLRTAIGLVQLAITFKLLSFFLTQESLFEAFGVNELSAHAGLTFFSILFGPVQTLLGLASQAWSRRCEYEADRYALETTGTSEPLVAALKRLSVDSLSNLTPHPLYVLLHHSHPPVVERLAALKAAG